MRTVQCNCVEDSVNNKLVLVISKPAAACAAEQTFGKAIGLGYSRLTARWLAKQAAALVGNGVSVKDAVVRFAIPKREKFSALCKG